jgi:hypothetical protein
VNVQAVTLAVRMFREHDSTRGPVSQMEVEARSPAVTHTVSVGKVEDCFGGAESPKEKLLKRAAERVAGVVGASPFIKAGPYTPKLGKPAHAPDELKRSRTPSVTDGPRRSGAER